LDRQEQSQLVTLRALEQWRSRTGRAVRDELLSRNQLLGKLDRERALSPANMDCLVNVYADWGELHYLIELLDSKDSNRWREAFSYLKHRDLNRIIKGGAR